MGRLAAEGAYRGSAELTAAGVRPGTSEHQTGLAVDLSDDPATCGRDACFGATPQGRWLVANSWRQGAVTLEDFFGLAPAPVG